MKKYIIVEGRGLDALVKNVNDAYNNGYRPVGGAFRICVNEGDLWFGQSMVLA